jgi:hypothetical protein
LEDKTLRYVAVALFLMLTTSAIATAQEIPLPSNVTIVSPATDVPADAARFSGKWSGGKWDGKLSSILIVEKITPAGDAEVVFALGDYQPWRATKTWKRCRGRIEHSTRKIDIPSYDLIVATASYSFNRDGALVGKLQLSGSEKISTIILYRE